MKKLLALFVIFIPIQLLNMLGMDDEYNRSSMKKIYFTNVQLSDRRVSSDGGLTWDKIWDIQKKFENIFFTDGHRNKYFSNDSGKTWQILKDESQNTSENDLEYSILKGNIFISSVNGINTLYVFDLLGNKMIENIDYYLIRDNSYSVRLIFINKSPKLSIILVDNKFIIKVLLNN